MELSAQLPPVRVVGRYAIHGEIAAGGMATVHIGRLLGPVGFSRTVAIKQLHPQFAKDPEFVSMFLDEARLAARIRHPNVVPTLDVVTAAGELFLIMEYVQGETLARLARSMRKRDERIPPRILAAILSGALYGLHAAHEARNEKGEPLGIVHRDISPQNILVGTDGVARVLDFGVAKAGGRIQTTREGQLKGKLSYMSPEQIRGTVTQQTDIYAAAVVLWEALAGKRLFSGENEAQTLDKLLHSEVEPPSRQSAEAPSKELDALDLVALRGLDRDPSKRFATAREMAIAIEECISPASAGIVGAWVERWAAEMLAARAERIAEIESSSSVKISALDLADQIALAAGEEPASLPSSGPRSKRDSGISTARPSSTIENQPPDAQAASPILPPPNSQPSDVSVSRLGSVVSVLPSGRPMTLVFLVPLAVSVVLAGLMIQQRRASSPAEATTTSASPVASTAASEGENVPSSMSSPNAPDAIDLTAQTAQSGMPVVIALRGTPAPNHAIVHPPSQHSAAATVDPPSPQTASPISNVPPAPVAVVATTTAAVATAAPPPFDPSGAHVDVGVARCAGTTPGVVSRVLAPLSARISQCYRSSLTPANASPIAATLHLQTDEDGVITDARTRGVPPGADSCIEGALRGRKIPNVDTGSASADIPLALRPR